MTGWMIPTIFTIAIWCWAFFMPLPKHLPTASFDLSGFFSAMFRLAVAVVGTLIFWLIYFIGRAAA